MKSVSSFSSIDVRLRKFLLKSQTSNINDNKQDKNLMKNISMDAILFLIREENQD